MVAAASGAAAAAAAAAAARAAASCRICWEDGGNIMELECECRGDIAMVHDECARRWFASRQNTRNSGRCDVCNGEVRNMPLLPIDQGLERELQELLSRAFSGTSAAEIVVEFAHERGRVVSGNMLEQDINTTISDNPDFMIKFCIHLAIARVALRVVTSSMSVSLEPQFARAMEDVERISQYASSFAGIDSVVTSLVPPRMQHRIFRIMEATLTTRPTS